MFSIHVGLIFMTSIYMMWFSNLDLYVFSSWWVKRLVVLKEQNLTMTLLKWKRFSETLNSVDSRRSQCLMCGIHSNMNSQGLHTDWPKTLFHPDWRSAYWNHSTDTTGEMILPKTYCYIQCHRWIQNIVYTLCIESVFNCIYLMHESCLFLVLSLVVYTVIAGSYSTVHGSW